MSPGNQMLRHSIHSKPPTPQANPHHLMIQPPNMGHHPATLGPPPIGGSSLDALRAHAAQAAASMQQQQQQQQSSVMHPPSPMNIPPKPPSSDEVIKVEPDPEPTTPEEESQCSPVAPPRGPSPEPRIEDTECHRSQSAM